MWGNLTQVAGNVRVPHISGETRADHGALRQRVLHRALRVGAAGCEHSARVAAHLIEARQSAGTVAVHSALGLRLGD